MTEHTDYRLALILPHSRQLLGVQRTGTVELPVIRVHLWDRPAEQMTKELEQRWGIRAIILDILPGPEPQTPCAVAELRTPSWDFGNEGLCVARPESVAINSISESQRCALGAILLGDATDAGAFSQIGWIERAQQWIQSSVQDREIVFTGEIRQLNAGRGFCLLRLGTQSGPAYWIKGVGEPNTHEFAITRYLSDHCSTYLPPIVATRADWNAWVMEEFGSSLHNSDSLDDFDRAARRLASLQIQLLGRSEELLGIHCADHRIATLASHIDEAIDYLEVAMCQQTSVKVLALSSTRLREIGNILHDACFALEALGIPDSLMHNDISPGSILNNGKNIVFTDWCEACVGCPFVTLEQLCVRVARKTNQPQSWSRSLGGAYSSCWAALSTERQVRTALQITPLISAFSHFYGRGDWLQSPRRHETAFQVHARSLARHMDRIAGVQV